VRSYRTMCGEPVSFRCREGVPQVDDGYRAQESLINSGSMTMTNVFAAPR
jgi:hypothetical protein